MSKSDEDNIPRPLPEAASVARQWEAEGGSVALMRPSRRADVCFVRYEPQGRPDRRLVMWSRPRARSAHAFRVLRDRLYDQGDPRVILCSSINPNEGKTAVACNLALSLAERPERPSVLLLEAGVRANALGRLFGFAPVRGFKIQLTRHKSDPESPWVVVQVGDHSIYVLAMGVDGCGVCGTVLRRGSIECPSCGADTRFSRDLDIPAFVTALEGFRAAFDYVVLDAPPVLGGDEVNAILEGVDGVVIATRRGRTNDDQLRAVVDQLAPTPITAVMLLDD